MYTWVQDCTGCEGYAGCIPGYNRTVLGVKVTLGVYLGTIGLYWV